MRKILSFAAVTVVTIVTAALAACHGGHHHVTTAPEPPRSEAPLTEAAIAVPIAPGQTAAWQSALAELTGPRYAEYQASRQRFGLTSQTTFLQRTPMGDFALIHLTGADVRASFHAMSTSQDAWDVKWRELTKSLHGFDFATGERVIPKIEPLYAMEAPAAAGSATGKPFMFLAPVAPGGAERLRALAATVMGERHGDYIRARAQLGVAREAVFFESAAAGEAIVVYWLAADPAASLAQLARSTDPFDVWLRGEIAPAHPIPLDAIAELASRNTLVGQFPR